MVCSGATVDEVTAQAATLARGAYRKLANLEARLDSLFGSSEFRLNSIDPLLDKERQLEAIRRRVTHGGRCRTSDRGNLASLLSKREHEYDALKQQFPWDDLSLRGNLLVSQYLQERRIHLRMSDPERVRALYSQLASRLPLGA